MSVLLFAPRTSSLSYREDEIEGILRSGLAVTVRIGVVSYRDFVREVSESSAEILWVVGHGNEIGIELSDGVVSYALLTPLVAKFSLVVLNTCYSLDAAHKMQARVKVDAVVSVGEVNDQEAFQFGLLFAQELAKHGDPRAAFTKALPVDGKQLYLSSVLGTHGMSEISELSKAMGELTRAVYKLDARMEAIEKAVAMTQDHEGRLLKLEAQTPNLYAIAGSAAGVGVVIAELFRLILN